MNIEKQEVDVNMNVQAKVMLTEYGKEILKKYYEELNCIEHIPNTEKEITISLWEISNIFGKYLYMGNTKIPFVDNKVKIDFKVNESNKIETI